MCGSLKLEPEIWDLSVFSSDGNSMWTMLVRPHENILLDKRGRKGFDIKNIKTPTIGHQASVKLGNTHDVVIVATYTHVI